MESGDKGYYSNFFPIPKRDGNLDPTLGLLAVTAYLQKKKHSPGIIKQ